MATIPKLPRKARVISYAGFTLVTLFAGHVLPGWLGQGLFWVGVVALFVGAILSAAHVRERGVVRSIQQSLGFAPLRLETSDLVEGPGVIKAEIQGKRGDEFIMLVIEGYNSTARSWDFRAARGEIYLDQSEAGWLPLPRLTHENETLPQVQASSRYIILLKQQMSQRHWDAVAEHSGDKNEFKLVLRALHVRLMGNDDKNVIAKLKLPEALCVAGDDVLMSRHCSAGPLPGKLEDDIE